MPPNRYPLVLYCLLSDSIWMSILNNNSNEQDEGQHNVILETPMTKEAMNRSGTDRLYRLEEPDTKRSKEDKKSKKKKDKKDKVCISIYKFLYNISTKKIRWLHTAYIMINPDGHF